jgi:hypothetical protein
VDSHRGGARRTRRQVLGQAALSRRPTGTRACETGVGFGARGASLAVGHGITMPSVSNPLGGRLRGG